MNKMVLNIIHYITWFDREYLEQGNNNNENNNPNENETQLAAERTNPHRSMCIPIIY